MSDFEKSINASDLIDWIMCAFPDWCVGDVRAIIDHVNEMTPAQPEPCEELDFVQEHKKISVVLDIQQKGKSTPSAQPDLSSYSDKLWKNAYERGKAEAQAEIVRCKDCKYAEDADAEDTQDGYTCQFHRGSIWFSGSYCSWAERRTDESDK